MSEKITKQSFNRLYLSKREYKAAYHAEIRKIHTRATEMIAERAKALGLRLSDVIKQMSQASTVFYMAKLGKSCLTLKSLHQMWDYMDKMEKKFKKETKNL